jgi:hypothetical protein
VGRVPERRVDRQRHPGSFRVTAHQLPQVDHLDAGLVVGVACHPTRGEPFQLPRFRRTGVGGPLEGDPAPLGTLLLDETGSFRLPEGVGSDLLQVEGEQVVLRHRGDHRLVDR